MEYTQYRPLLNLKKANSYQNDFNTINYYLNTDSSKNKAKNFQNEKIKNNFINLNDPRLVQAYNEGYYGKNNIPKKYYIYPNFYNYNKSKNYHKEKTINENLIDKNNFRSLKKQNKSKDYCTTKKFPFLQQINHSSNKFGKFHSISVYNNLDKFFENRKKKNEDENSENSINVSMKLSDDKKLKIKGYARIIKNKDVAKNKEIIDDSEEDNENYDKYLYYTNNPIMRRNIINASKLYKYKNIWVNS